MAGVLLDQLGEQLLGFGKLAKLKLALGGNVLHVGCELVMGIGRQEGRRIFPGVGIVGLAQRREAGQVEGLGRKRVLRILRRQGSVQGDGVAATAGNFVDCVGLVHQHLGRLRAVGELGQQPLRLRRGFHRLARSEQAADQPVAGLAGRLAAGRQDPLEQLLRRGEVAGQVVALPASQGGRGEELRLRPPGRDGVVEGGGFGIFLQLRQGGGLADGGMVGQGEFRLRRRSREARGLLLARQVHEACVQIGKDLGMESVSELSQQMLATTKDILHYDEKWEEEEAYLAAIHEVIHEALANLLQMKQIEGKALAQDMIERLKHMKSSIEEIALASPQAVSKQRQKLKERLEEVVPGSVENEDRLLREICLYAEKVDITEELTRFRSHLNQFEQLLHSSETSIGKTIEFLLQELNREINTIGSKASDITISQKVIEVKSELEKIREQIQNVE